MKIIPLSEGTFTIDKTKRFVPFDDSEHQLHERPAGSLLVAKYDADGKKAMELRREWWQQGEAEGWTFLFYHDVKHPVFSFGVSR